MTHRLTHALAADLARIVAGSVIGAVADLDRFAHDYGNIVHRQPQVAVLPSTSDDVAQVIRYAARHGIPVAPRGVGHTLAGQALSAESIVIDMSCLRRIEHVDTDAGWVQAEAGALWHDIVAATTLYGLTPPVLTGYPHVSIGGTHSTVGWGTSSFRYGAQADNCLAIEVITGTGERIWCSPVEHSQLFYHALCGLGQFGVITRVRHQLRRFRPYARTYTLHYDHLEPYLHDNRILMQRTIVEQIESVILRRADGIPAECSWTYIQRITVEGDSSAVFDDDAALADLHFDRLASIDDIATDQFLAFHESPPAIHQAGMCHPWLVIFLPYSRTQSYIEACLGRLPLGVLGGSNAQLRVWIAPHTVTQLPMLRTPDEETIVLFGIFPAVHCSQLAPVTALLQMASDLGLKLGGKRHLATWVDFDLARWRLHYGEHWPVVQALKHIYDPKGILNPGFLPLEIRD